MDLTLPALPPAQESLFLTLGGRALDSRLRHPFLGDPMADEILGRTGYDLAPFPSLTSRRTDPRTKVFDIAVRAKRLDEVVRRFVARHPDAVVLDLGAGLDSRMFRVDPPATVDWYDVDFPAVLAVREQVVPHRANAHPVGADVTAPHWLAGIPAERPAVIVFDGLIPFLTPAGFTGLLNRLTGHFRTGELTFNLYTTWAIWAIKHLRSLAAIAGSAAHPGFNDPREPERWTPGLRLAEEILLTRAPELEEFPLFLRWVNRPFARSARISRMVGTVVVRYTF